MLDADLAEHYGVETKIIVRAVKRYLYWFPADFIIQLSNTKLHANVSFT
ncbi:MAG: ORF6N domain-containing protein [Nitrospirota bacterium]